ncbi:uncharacterized protein LOC135695966 [Rhopilema esculentum]|uniref:uncharacterized protein LOC135695966 n=1 Tax=Rhopilema esculentum TaxID=499914 RepID=UPI0031D94E56
MIKYIPTEGVHVEVLDGIGAVEVSNEFVYIPTSILPKLEKVITSRVDLQLEVKLLREQLWFSYGSSETIPPFEPEKIQEVCRTAGATKLFHAITTAMSQEHQTPFKKEQNEKKAVAIIYMLVYGQSQKANWFQKIFAQNMTGKGISESGLAILNQTGISVSKSTQRRDLIRTADSHESTVIKFIDEAIEKKCLLTLMIDDYTNVHTIRRPKDQVTSTATKMATILLKKFPSIPAISSTDASFFNQDGISIEILENHLKENLPNLLSSFATIMPYWVKSSFFNPEIERSRLEIHDYQQDQTSTKSLRKMENCKLVDEVEQKLRSFDDFLKTSAHALKLGLQKYLQYFLCPQPGDWPAQFYMRQVQYNIPENFPSCLKNIIPMIGPLHIQLNARECVCLLNIDFFKMFYSFIFGDKKQLANKPKPWRISLLLEILYGGWTLIREQVIVIFSNCKSIEFLTLLNILDNYLPLVLSIYSVIFKTGRTSEYLDAVLRCWLMFFCYKRHHYNKAPLVWLSNILFWKANNHPLFQALLRSLNAFDEYPVENFHSLLRSQTVQSDDAELISRKAKEVDSNKTTSAKFSSAFMRPKKFNFSSSKLKQLKIKASKFIFNILKSIKEQPNAASQVNRPANRQKGMTYWKLPHIYGETIVSSKVLPVGFQFAGKEPNPLRFVAPRAGQTAK